MVGQFSNLMIPVVALLPHNHPKGLVGEGLLEGCKHRLVNVPRIGLVIQLNIPNPFGRSTDELIELGIPAVVGNEEVQGFPKEVMSMEVFLEPFEDGVGVRFWLP